MISLRHWVAVILINTGFLGVQGLRITSGHCCLHVDIRYAMRLETCGYILFLEGLWLKVCYWPRLSDTEIQSIKIESLIIWVTTRGGPLHAPQKVGQIMGLR